MTEVRWRYAISYAETQQPDAGQPVEVTAVDAYAGGVVISILNHSCPEQPGQEELPDDHVHHWVILAVQPHIPLALLGPPLEHTIVLGRCTGCGEPATWELVGKWKQADLESYLGGP